MSEEESYGRVLSTPSSPTHTAIDFEVVDWKDVKVGKYVTVSKELGKEFIGVITNPHIYRAEYSDPSLLKYYRQRGIDPAHVLPGIGSYACASARIIGVWDGSKLVFDGTVPEPGKDVRGISRSKLQKILKFREADIFLGHLFHYPENEVKLNSEIFMGEHSAIFGVTRSGKSYTSGVTLEELIKKGLPLLIIDPHGEYNTLGQKNDVEEDVKRLKEIGLEALSFKIVEYSPPRFVDEEKEITINFSDLTAGEIIDLTGFTGENQIAVIHETVRSFEERDYTIDQFLEELENVNRRLGNITRTVTIKSRIEVLKHLGVFGEGFDPEEIIKDGQTTIINLSGLDLRTQRITVAAILRRLFSKRTFGEISPFCLFIEEVHRFAPSSTDPISKTIVDEIAKEGGKFGISLHVVSQRPSEVSSTVLSQCETKIFHKLTEVPDVNYASSVLRATSPELADIIPNLSVGSAIVTGGITNYQPQYVLIRPRQSKHGGGTGKVRLRKRKYAESAGEGTEPKQMSLVN